MASAILTGTVHSHHSITLRRATACVVYLVRRPDGETACRTCRGGRRRRRRAPTVERSRELDSSSRGDALLGNAFLRALSSFVSFLRKKSSLSHMQRRAVIKASCRGIDKKRRN